ncbi:unnamed protein product [Closterium sp. NIES-53]
MASLRVLAFDHEGRPIQLDTWLDDLQVYLLSDSRDSVLLFDHTSGASPAPPTTADSATRSQWLTRDAAARLAICNHLLLAECAHFGQHRTAHAMYGAVVARYSSPATAALGRLLLPYLFPELSAFATVEDLVTHLRTSNARYRATLPAEFLDRNPPRSLTVDLLEQHLLAAETSVVVVGAARGTPRTPFFEGCSPSPLAPSYALAAAVDVLGAEDVGAASASGKRRSSKGKGGRGGGGGSRGGGGGSRGGGGGSSGGGGGNGGGGGGGSGGGSGGFGGSGGGSGGGGSSGGSGSGGGQAGATQRRGSCGGQRQQQQQQQRRSETPSPQQLREWISQRGASGGSGSCPYVIRTEFGDEVERPRWAELLRSRVAIFDLDYDAILAAMYALSVSAEGDCYLCVPPDPGIEAAALGASDSALPGTAPAEALHTFTLDSGASRCFFRDSTTLTPHSAPVPIRLADPSEGAVVARSSTVLPCPTVPSGSLSVLPLPSFSTNLVSTAALQDAMVTTTTTPRDSSVTPPPGSPLPATPSWHAFPPPCLWSSQVSASPPALACPALPSLHRGAAARCSSLLVSPDDCSPADSPHGRAGPSPRLGQGRECYFLLVVDDYTRYTTVFPLRSKGEDLPVLRLHSDRGGEFSFDLLQYFCRGEGILQTFTLPASPQQNGIAERRIGLVMEPRVSLPETSLTLRWTGKVGDASVFRIRGSRAFVRDTSADKLSARAIPCDVTFDESVPFYCLFPYRSAPPPPPPIFFAPGPPPVDPLLPQGPAPSGVSQVDPPPRTVPVEVAVDSGAESEGAGSEGAELGGAEPRGAEPAGVEPGGAEPEGVEPGGAESEDAESGGAEPWGIASSGGPAGASPRLSPRPKPLSLQQLREWFAQRTRLRSGAAGAGDTGAGGAGISAGAGGTRVGGAGAGDPVEPGGAGAGGAGARGTGAGGAGARGAGASDTGAVGAGSGGNGTGGAGAGGVGVGGTGAVDPGTRSAGARGVVSGGTGAGGTVRPRPFFVPLLRQVLSSPLPAPSPYAEQTDSFTKRREPESRPASPVCAVRAGRRVPRPRPPPVPGTHTMALRPSSVPQRFPLPTPPESSILAVPDPESDLACAASPAVSRLLATVVTDPSFESTAAFALVAELVDYAVACRLDYATALVAESESSSPPSVGGECSLGTDVLEDRHEDFECLAAAVPHFASMLLAPEGVPDAPDILAPRSYAERVDYFQTFSPTPKMTNLWVLLHVAAQRDYELHSLDSWSLQRPDYNLCQAPREWHDTLRTTLAALGFAPATADPSLFLRTDTSLPLFYVLVYVDDLVFPTTDTEALTLVKSELQKRHTCTDLVTRGAPLPSALRLVVLLATAHSSVYWPLALNSTFGRYVGHGARAWRTGLVVLTGHADASWVDDLATQRSSQGYTFSLGSGSVSWRSTRSSSVLSSSCEAEIYAGVMAAQELRWLTYLLTDLGEQPRSPSILYQRGQLRLVYVATRANTADVFTKALQSGDHQRFSTVLGLLALLFLTGLKLLVNFVSRSLIIAVGIPCCRTTVAMNSRAVSLAEIDFLHAAK